MVPNFVKIFANSPVALRAFLGLNGIDSEGSLEAPTAEIVEVRNAGYSDSDIVENITHVGLNVLSNIIGKASQVEIDFSKVEIKLAS